MPKIKVKTATPVPINPSKPDDAHAVTFVVATDDGSAITTSGVTVAATMGGTAYNAVAPISVPNKTDEATLVYPTSTELARGTAYSLSSAQWTFDASGSGSLNASETSVLVGDPTTVQKKKRSIWQRILDFFRRLFG